MGEHDKYMDVDECREKIGAFVDGILRRSYHNRSEDVFTDGRGYWNFYLPSDIHHALLQHSTAFYVVRDFAAAAMVWQAEYKRDLTAEGSAADLRVLVFIDMPLLNAVVQVIYSDAAEALCFDFYRRSYGELIPIRNRQLTESLGLAKGESVEEIGFKFWRVDKPSVEFKCGEVWLLGDIPESWSRLHQTLGLSTD